MYINVNSLNQGTGIQFSGMINAAQLAICCGATLSLPSNYLWSKQNLFKFKINHASFCKNMSGGTDYFFYQHIPKKCRTYEIRKTSYITLLKYLNFPLKCSQSYDAVAHVRPLTSHSNYPQPPFKFYLKSWKQIGTQHELKVVHKSFDNPIVYLFKHIAFLGNITFSSHDNFKEDLKVLLCAKHVIMSKSSLSHLVLLNPRLHSFYEYETRLNKIFPDFVSNCSLKYYTTNGTYLRHWKATPLQLNYLMTDQRKLTFHSVKFPCLS